MRFDIKQTQDGAWSVLDIEYKPPPLPPGSRLHEDEEPRFVAICKNCEDAETIRSFMNGNLIQTSRADTRAEPVTIQKEARGYVVRGSSRDIATFVEEPEARAFAAFKNSRSGDERYRAWEVHRDFLRALRSFGKS